MTESGSLADGQLVAVLKILVTISNLADCNFFSLSNSKCHLLGSSFALDVLIPRRGHHTSISSSILLTFHLFANFLFYFILYKSIFCHY